MRGVAVGSVPEAEPGELAGMAGRRTGVVCALGAGSDPNASVVRFGAGQGVGEHGDDEVDVVVAGVSALGVVEMGGEEHALGAGALVLVPEGVRRSARGASEASAYPTVHKRRGPLRIRP